jgi:hypothetical protein
VPPRGPVLLKPLNRGALSAKDLEDASGRPLVDTHGDALYPENVAAIRQFLDILLKPDNIPIAGMLVLVFFFTWVGFKQALRNDRLMEQGREDEILKEMQE